VLSANVDADVKSPMHEPQNETPNIFKVMLLRALLPETLHPTGKTSKMSLKLSYPKLSNWVSCIHKFPG
jgi:hypothetical protein